MNFSPHSSNFNSASQQQSQQQTMNTYNSSQYYPVPTFTGYPYPPNNYQLYNFSSQQGCNYNPNSFYPSKTTETTIQGPKREYKPLVVFDPTKNEAIDLVEASKTTKRSIVVDETRHDSSSSKVSVSLNTLIVSHCKKSESISQTEHDATFQDELEADEKEQEETDQEDPEISKKDDQSVTDEDEYESSGHDTDTRNHAVLDSTDMHNTDCSPTIKYSQSIPKNMNSNFIDYKQKLEISLSENNLHEKCISGEIETEKRTEKSRLIYDRNTLLKISESPLCRKPDLDCKEIIETQSMKNYNIVHRINTPKTFVRSEHGYKPPNIRSKVEVSSKIYLENLRRNFKCILNKIAPQNFDVCLSNIKKLLTDTDWTMISVEDCMAAVIEEIFDKAVQEEGYSVTYANLCTNIVNYEEKHKTEWSFKISLINRCKDMFETPLQDQLKSVREYWEKRTNDEKDEKLKILYKSDIEEQVKKAKDKYFGNIRFIGELYLHDLLKANIINTCVVVLQSKGNDEDALFSLCKLLETVGKKFDNKHIDKMNEYIKDITKIAENEDLSTRIKFRLFDIIEMSQRHWSLRQIQVQKMIQPKTLDQVKKDDLDEKNLEASKLSNKSQIRMIKKNNNSGDIKIKPQQNKMQSLEINSLQMKPSNSIQLKPSYGQWKAGSGVKDNEWTNVEGSKKNTRYGKHNSKYSYQNNKASPVTSRDESPSKVDIGGRFALLQLEDIENSMDSKDSGILSTDQTFECDKLCPKESTSSASTREQSPINLEYSDMKSLSSEDIFKKLLDSGYLDVDSWCQLTDISQTVANWIDGMMEKNKLTRNIVGDEFSKLLNNGKLSMTDLTDGIKKFSEEIDDLKTDIPLIWNFLAEFLERLIVDSKSDLSFFKVLLESTEYFEDVGSCISMCLKYADERLGHIVMKIIVKEEPWLLKDFDDNEHLFLRSKGLDFLLDDVLLIEYFDKYRDDLISLLPNDDDEVNQFLIENFGLEITQTEQCVYFVSHCVFSYLSNLQVQDIINFLCKMTLFFFRLLDHRSEFEKQTLEALSDSFSLFKEAGIMAVINGLSDNILSYDAFQQFIQRDQHNQSTVTFDNGLATAVYSVMYENSKR